MSNISISDTPTTIIVGDVHIGKGVNIGKPGIGHALNSRIKDQIFILDWIHQQALNNNTCDIILTGDVFEDTRPAPILIILFLDWLRKCSTDNIKVHIVAGNHEMIRTGSTITSVLDVISCADIPNVYVYKQTETIETFGAHITLLPFRDRRSFGVDSNQKALKIIEDTLQYHVRGIPLNLKKVLVGHLALEGSIPVGDEFDDISNELICPTSMFIDYDYVWMGHVHKPQVRLTKPYMAHIGSMDLSDFGETDHNKIIVIIDPSSKEFFREVRIPTRPLHKIQITVPSFNNTTNYIVNYINEMNKHTPLKDAIIKLEIQLYGREAESSDRATIENLIYSLGAHYICSFSESRNISVVPIVKQNIVDNTMDISTAIKMYSEHTTFEDDNLKSLFVEEAMEVLQQYIEDVK